MTAPHQHTERSGNGLRILRAAVFAAVCVVLAAAGHTFASCATVPLWTLAAGFLGVLAAAVPLAGRTRSPGGIAALLAVGQAVLHTLFGLGQQAAASGVMAMSMSSTASPSDDTTLVARAARLLCGTTTESITPAHARRILTAARLYDQGPTGTGGAEVLRHPAAALPAADGSLTSLLPSLPMLLCHVLAALAAGWLLRRGDLALLRLIALSAHSVADGAVVRPLRGALALARALYAGPPAAPEPGPRPWRTALTAAPKPRTTALRHTVIRRGPPAAALALAA